MSVPDPCIWIASLSPDDVTPRLRKEARRCLLDTLGVAVAATDTRLASIMATFVPTQFGGEQPLMFTAGRASPAGAALHGAALVDSLDAHDGQVLTKGHVGVSVMPVLLSMPGVARLEGGELLTRIVLGYEIATRAGIALHATAADYHTSGAWNALGAAAVAGRHLRLDAAALEQALGIAEFYGPRSQMMRCIDHPTMVKDGSAWGAFAGVSAAFLAQAGFTGAPALTLRDPAVASLWADLGQRWYLLEQYRKPYPICRWAQPAVEAVRWLRGRFELPLPEVVAVEVETFHEARRLATVHPETTEQAQYSLPWAVACALLNGAVGAGDVAEPALGDRERQSLSERVHVREAERFNARFPAERWARVRLRLRDGAVIDSEACQAQGDHDRPLDDAALMAKYRALAEPVLGQQRAEAIRVAVDELEEGGSCERLAALVHAPRPTAGMARHA